MTGEIVQGEHRSGMRLKLVVANWSPTARLLVGSVGGAVTAAGMTRRELLGIGVGGLVAGPLPRCATNKPVTRLTGAGAGIIRS